MQAPQAKRAWYAKLATALSLKALRQVVENRFEDVVQLVRTLPCHRLETPVRYSFLYPIAHTSRAALYFEGVLHPKKLSPISIQILTNWGQYRVLRRSTKLDGPSR